MNKVILFSATLLSITPGLAQTYNCSFDSDIGSIKPIHVTSIVKVGETKVIQADQKNPHSPAAHVAINIMDKNKIYKDYLQFSSSFIEDVFEYNQTGILSASEARGYITTVAKPGTEKINTFSGGTADQTFFSLVCDLIKEKTKQ